MQVLLQVLNNELTSDTAKSAIAPDVAVPNDDENAFTALLENPGNGDSSVAEFSLSSEIETPDLNLRRSNDTAVGFRSIGSVVPNIVGEALRGSANSPDENLVPDELTTIEPEQIDASHITTKLLPQAGVFISNTEEHIWTAPLESSSGKVSSTQNATVIDKANFNDDLPKKNAFAPTIKPNIEETQKITSEEPAPIVSRTTLTPREIDTGARHQDTPEKIVSREFSASREAVEKLGVEAIASTSTTGLKDADVAVKDTDNTIKTAAFAALDDAPQKATAPRNVPDTKKEFLAPAPKDAPNIVPASVEKLIKTKDARSIQRDSTAEVTVTVTPKTDAPEPTQMVQVAGVSKSIVPIKETVIGVETAAFKEDGISQTPLSDRSDVSRKLEMTAPRFETAARPVITQLVQATKTATDGVIEVKLSPEELGRVRLTMSNGETGMTVLVTAERQETLDLLRRNIDLFAADLAEQGFTDLNFSFGQNGADDQKDFRSDSGLDNEDIVLQPTNGATHPAGPIASSGRLDLRL